MTQYAHFLLTRFNLHTPEIVLSDAWYEQRFGLFEQFCLPSIKAQTNQSFRWLLFADAHTPRQYRSRIEHYQTYDNVQVHWLAGYDPTQMIRAVHSLLSDSLTHLITTTLDNDDALARDFVARVQEEFAGQSFELINLLHGLRYDLPSQKLYICDLESNPFISLIEQIGAGGQIRSISGCLPHSTIKQRFSQIRNVDNAAPLWLQVVHGRNVAPTGTWGRARARLDLMDALFDLDYDAPPESVSDLALRVQHGRARLERGLIGALSGEQKRRILQLLKGQRR